MTLSFPIDFFTRISESIGLAPIVLLCTLALFLFVFIFGIILLVKLKSIRTSIIHLNGGLDILIQMLSRETQSITAQQPHEKRIEVRSDIKSHIIRYLQKAGKPVSYSDIVKQLSKIYPDRNCDYETIIEELDQLKGRGEILSQLYFGKLYFKINEADL